MIKAEDEVKMDSPPEGGRAQRKPGECEVTRLHNGPVLPAWPHDKRVVQTRQGCPLVSYPPPYIGACAQPLRKPEGEKTTAELQEELAKARQEAEENWDKYLRAMAEMENYKKRLARNHAEQLQQERRRLLSRFLTVSDNLERAMAHAEAGDGLLRGVQVTYQDLQKLLATEGVEAIDAVAQPFDPRYHEAVEVVPNGDAVEEGTVVAEVEKGYLYGDQLLRPAKVRVAK